MTRPTIFVTGATGKTGAAVVEQLLAKNWPVRAAVHTIDARSEHLRGLGAEVVQADLFDVEQLDAAMRGTQRAYYCPPWHPHMLHSAVSFAVAARANDIEAIVGLSQWLASPAHPSLATRQNWLTDQLFSMIPGAAHIIVNPGFFADNYLRLIDFAAHLGIFPLPLGTGRNAPPSNEDIARVIVGALLDPDRHHGHTYRPTGPELLDAHQMTEILSLVLDRKVRHIEMPMWMMFKALRALRISAFEQVGLRSYIEEHKQGAFELGAPTDHVRLVAGVEPESFEATVGRYAALPQARRSFANTTRALATFARIGMTPAYNLDRFEHRQQHPQVRHAQLVSASARWRTEHVHQPVAVPHAS